MSTQASLNLAPPDPSARSHGPWTLLAATFGFFMISLDATIVTVALPTLHRDLHADLIEQQWVIDGYTLMFAGLLLTGGSLGDRLGARRVYGIGLAVFVMASLACGVATSPTMLIVSRFAQGVGAALQLPTSLAMIRHGYPDPVRRTRAIAIWAAVSGGAIAAGPVLGGTLIATAGWRSLFLINLVVGAVGLLCTLRADAPPAGRGRQLDLPGQVAGVVALCALTFGLIEGGELGWSSAPILITLALSVLFGGFFVWWERRTSEPMLPMHLFANPAFSAASVVGFAMNFAFYGIVFLLSLFLQNERDYSAIETGLMFLPMTGTVTAANLLGGRLTTKFGPRLPLVAGLLTFAAGLLGLCWAGPAAPNWTIWLAILPIGVGGGITVPAMTSAVLETVTPANAGIASGELNAARQVGGAVGVALFGTLIADNFHSGLRSSLLTAAAGLVIAALTAARWTPGQRALLPATQPA